MASTLTNSFNLLKDRQEGVVNNALNTFTSVFSRFPEHEGLTGRKTIRSIRHGRPAGFALGPGAQALPVASKTKYSRTNIYPAYWYQTLAIDWDLIEQSKDQQGAFASIISDTMAAASESAVMRMERMSMGDGSGRLGSATLTNTSTTAGAVLTFDLASAADDQVFFEEGERIQFMYDTGTATAFNTWQMRTNPSQGYYEIDSVSRSGTTLTITCDSDSLLPAGSNAPQDGDTVIVAGSIAVDAVSGTTNAGHELNGLKILIDDGDQPVLTNTADTFPAAATFQAVASSNTWWQSKVIDGTGNYLTRKLVHDAADEISNHGGGNGAEDVKYIVAHSFQITQYVETLYPNERFGNTGASGKFSSGSDTMFTAGAGPMIGNRETVKNRYCDKSIAYLVGPGCERLTLKPWGFYDNDGVVFRPDPAGRPRDVAYAYAYLQLATMKRNCSGRIENLTTS